MHDKLSSPYSSDYLDKFKFVLLTENFNVIGSPSPDTPAKYNQDICQAEENIEIDCVNN
jgi:hypothetical protein